MSAAECTNFTTLLIVGYCNNGSLCTLLLLIGIEFTIHIAMASKLGSTESTGCQQSYPDCVF